MRGYPRNIWTEKHAYWIWTPVIATILSVLPNIPDVEPISRGGLVGALIYDVLLFEGDESWVNGTWGRVGGKEKHEKERVSGSV